MLDAGDCASSSSLAAIVGDDVNGIGMLQYGLHLSIQILGRLRMYPIVSLVGMLFGV